MASTQVSATARQLVSTLPRPLLNFFKKHPPASSTSWHAASGSEPRPQNPFHPSRNQYTNKYNEPRYSVRRQTDLVNTARMYGLDHLLPPRVDHKEKKHKSADTPMRGLIRWKGTKMERTREARRDAIKVKLSAAKVVVKKRTQLTKLKKRRQRTGLSTS